MTTDNGKFLLAYAQTSDNNSARLCLTRSTDGVRWSRPVRLTGPIPFGLITPFTNLTARGTKVAFGYNLTTGNWRSGQLSAQVVLSSDGGATFERIDLGRKFNYGSLFPVTAFDADSNRVGCVTVALVPEEPDALAGNINRGNFRGDAYLVFASSPSVWLGPKEPDAKLTARIARLIKQLGDDKYEKRVQATRELQKLSVTAIPSLEKATRHANPEIITRARILLRRVYPPWLKPPTRQPAR